MSISSGRPHKCLQPSPLQELFDFENGIHAIPTRNSQTVRRKDVEPTRIIKADLLADRTHSKGARSGDPEREYPFDFERAIWRVLYTGTNNECWQNEITTTRTWSFVRFGSVLSVSNSWTFNIRHYRRRRCRCRKRNKQYDARMFFENYFRNITDNSGGFKITRN